MLTKKKQSKWDVLSAFVVASVTLYGSLILNWPIVELIILYWFHTALKAVYCISRILELCIRLRFHWSRWILLLSVGGFGYFLFFGLLNAYAYSIKAAFGINLYDSIETNGFIFGVLYAIEYYHLVVPIVVLILSFGFNWLGTKTADLIEAYTKEKKYDGPNWASEPFTTIACRGVIACLGYGLSVFLPETKLKLMLVVIISIDLSIDVFFREYFRQQKTL